MRRTLKSCLLTLTVLFLAVCSQMTHRANAAVFMYVDESSKLIQVNTDGTFSTLVNTLPSPAGLAADALGNIYATNRGLPFNGNTISKITPGGTVSTYATGGGLNTPMRDAFDKAGILYASNYSAGTVSAIDTSGNVSTYVTGLSNPHGLAFDGLGNLYVTQYSNGQIIKITPGLTKSTYSTVAGSALDDAFDMQGNLYVVAQSGTTGTIYKIAAGGGSPTTLTTFLNDAPQCLAFDAMGNLYCTTDNAGVGSIWKIDPTSGVKVEFVPGLASQGIVIVPSLLPVPEPASLSLVVCAAGSLLLARRRRK